MSQSKVIDDATRWTLDQVAAASMGYMRNDFVKVEIGSEVVSIINAPLCQALWDEMTEMANAHTGQRR